MAKEESFQTQGVVQAALANTQFRVRLQGNDTEIICYITGKMRKNFIRIIPGDEVTVEISPYDMSKGRIVFRGKQRRPEIEDEDDNKHNFKKKK